MLKKTVLITVFTAISLLFVGCNQTKTAIEIEETQQETETRPELSKTDITFSDIEEMSDIEKMFADNTAVLLQINEYNTQDSELFELHTYLEYISEDDYTYIYTDSDGYDVYQTPYYTYNDAYGDKSFSNGAVATADEIILQLQNSFVPIFENGTIEGEYSEKNEDNKEINVVCVSCNADDVHEFSSAWGYEEDEYKAEYKFDKDKKNLCGLDIYYQDDEIMSVQIQFNTKDDEISALSDKAMNYFNKNKENESLFAENE